MGIFNSTSFSVEDATKEYFNILGNGESIERAYRLIRDSILFTNKRLIFIDIQGLTGKKIEYHSIPYRSITHFSVETAGVFDLEAELKIYLSGTQGTIEKTFSKNTNIYEVQSVLADYIAKH